MMVQLLACSFVHGLRVTIGMDNMAEMVGRNLKEPRGESICHSHDFCDANMVMFEAFTDVMGREPGFVRDDAGQALSEADLELVNKAWDLARTLLETEFK